MKKNYVIVIAACIIVIVLVVALALMAGNTHAPPVMPTPTPAPTSSVIVSTPSPVPTPIVDPALLGTWNLKAGAVQGGTSFVFPTNVQITATFDNQGNVMGFAGCNNYNGVYTLSGQQLSMGMGITIGTISSTQKYCADTSKAETTYLGILQNARAYTVNGDGLTITDNLNNKLVYQR